MWFPSRKSCVAVPFLAVLFSAPAQAAGRQFLNGQVPHAVAASTAVRPLARSQRMNLAVGLPLRNQQELAQLLKDLADPASPNYRRYLTPSEFAERFGPTEADYQKLADFFTNQGLAVTGTHPNRMILDISGAAADVDRTFHVNMMTWRHPTRGEFFAPDREPSLDAGVAILDVTGLDNFVVAHPMDLQSRLIPRGQMQAQPMLTGSGPIGLFTGNDSPPSRWLASTASQARRRSASPDSRLEWSRSSAAALCRQAASSRSRSPLAPLSANPPSP